MNKEELEKVEQLIEQKDSEQLKDLLAGLHPADIAEPVSYTHLDVYKRQLRNRLSAHCIYHHQFQRTIRQRTINGL